MHVHVLTITFSVTYGFGFMPDANYDFCTVHHVQELINYL